MTDWKVEINGLENDGLQIGKLTGLWLRHVGLYTKDDNE